MGGSVLLLKSRTKGAKDKKQRHRAHLNVLKAKLKKLTGSDSYHGDHAMHLKNKADQEEYMSLIQQCAKLEVKLDENSPSMARRAKMKVIKGINMSKILLKAKPKNYDASAQLKHHTSVVNKLKKEHFTTDEPEHVQMKKLKLKSPIKHTQLQVHMKKINRMKAALNKSISKIKGKLLIKAR